MKKKRFKGEAVFTAMEKCFLIKLNRPVLTECVCVCVCVRARAYARIHMPVCVHKAYTSTNLPLLCTLLLVALLCPNQYSIRGGSGLYGAVTVPLCVHYE